MKALSIRQPWAWLILNAGKDIENRDWLTRFRGPFLIHASKGMTRAEDTEKDREIARLQCKHAEELRRAEESGYASGLQDCKDGKLEGFVMVASSTCARSVSHRDCPTLLPEQVRMQAFLNARLNVRGVTVGWGRDKHGKYLVEFARDAWAAWTAARGEA
jgi:hypothetical protein